MAIFSPSLPTQSCDISSGIGKMLLHVKQQHLRCTITASAKQAYSRRGNPYGRRMQSGSVIECKRHHNFQVLAMSESSIDQFQQPVSTSKITEGIEKVNSYLFRTEDGDLVKASVRYKNMGYSVYIEVSSLMNSTHEQKLALVWALYRSDSSSLFVPDVGSSTSETTQLAYESQIGAFKTPFAQTSSGNYTAKLEFDYTQVPFYLTFLLLSSSIAAGTDKEITTHRKTKFCVPVGAGSGYPMPLGVSNSNDGTMNFSLFSRNAEAVVLCLYEENSDKPSLVVELDPYVNRTGDIWHISIEHNEKFVKYGYRCKGSDLWDNRSRFHSRQVLLDPYAKRLGDFVPDVGEHLSLAKCLGCLSEEPAFDWNGDIHPRLPMEKLSVYRLNIGHFTNDKSSGLPADVAGTFSGVIPKLQHIKALGFNAILLEPVFPFDELKGPYFPYHFFSAMNSYGCTHNGASANHSLKETVKVLHANGVEVLLEVVFSHTSEGGDAAGQTISFRGIDNSSYYIVEGNTGKGADNMLKCNGPIVQQMILDSLRQWVTDFHIDGFCFINASHLLRGMNGDLLSRSPIVEAIAFDPLLSKAKIIADFWSPLDMLQTRVEFPHWKRWAEMNVKFFTDVRSFLGGKGILSDLATRLCGSGDVFSDSRGPAFSFNFVTRNSGLSLVDLVSFSADHLALELSWNCGEEGPTNINSVLKTRLRQVRNFLFILFVSLGVPVLNMGDEFGYSAAGSPSYSDRKPINWNLLKTGFGTELTQFITYLNSLRTRRSDLFQRKEFLKVENIIWHGGNQSPPEWEDPSCKFLGVTLKADDNEELTTSDKGDMFLSFNASNLPEIVVLPTLSEGTAWLRLIDTSLPFPEFFTNNYDPNGSQLAGSSDYEVQPHSCALFEVIKSDLRANVLYLK